MNTVFPVDIIFKKSSGTDTLIQGYTQNVSRGGLCVEFNVLKPLSAQEDLFKGKLVHLRISPTFSPRKIHTVSHALWHRQDDEEIIHYRLGMSYDDINGKGANRIWVYAVWQKWTPRVLAFLAILLIGTTLFLGMRQNELIRKNRQLVQKLVQNAISAEPPVDLDQAGMSVDRSIPRELYDWLKRHQKSSSGLVASYHGDPKLQNYSFTYDQSLLVQAFSLYKDFASAERILDFFAYDATQKEGGFLSAYDTLSGDALEWNVLSGPNVWIGIAALQYQRLSGDKTHQGLATGIGDWLVELTAEDPEGGLKGGPGMSWFSTEHNLDAYAFFNQLHQVTGEERYLRARESIFEWLMTHAVDQENKILMRGKGDATIATDTFSWSVAAIGPGRLAEMGLDPEGIMEFAETQCQVKTIFHRPDGKKVKVTGFDFARSKNIGRGGIVSAEWTAQAVVTYRIMAEYFESKGIIEKSNVYRGKVHFYLNELQKMIISSSSRTGQGKGCLPYATMPNADTGHGWRTPKGDRTGSVSATAYGLFAWLGYNPFDLEQITE